jgi:DhnA family fructose-bisphosphate aldolase class Ia
MYGKEIRLKRIFPSESRRLFSVPLDHAVSMGPIDGLEELRPLAEELQNSKVDLLIVTKGAVREIASLLRPPTLLGIHVSASTGLGSSSDTKVLVGTAEEATALGADLLSIQVNFGTPDEGAMLRDMGIAVDQCRTLGLPLLCMAYVKKSTPPSPDDLRHAARAAADLGADIVKTSYPGSTDEFRKLCRTTPVPVLIGGGVRLDDEAEFLRIVRESIVAGGRGICIGRNLFQRKPVGRLARQIATLLHGEG